MRRRQSGGGGVTRDEEGQEHREESSPGHECATFALWPYPLHHCCFQNRPVKSSDAPSRAGLMARVIMISRSDDSKKYHAASPVVIVANPIAPPPAPYANVRALE